MYRDKDYECMEKWKQTSKYNEALLFTPLPQFTWQTDRWEELRAFSYPEVSQNEVESHFILLTWDWWEGKRVGNEKTFKTTTGTGWITTRLHASFAGVMIMDLLHIIWLRKQGSRSKRLSEDRHSCMNDPGFGGVTFTRVTSVNSVTFLETCK